LKDLAAAIKISQAKIVYVVNLTNKKGHTIGFDVDDYIATLEQYIGKDRVNYAVFSSQKPLKVLVEKYEREEGKNTLVLFRKNKNPKRCYKLVRADIISKKIPKQNKNDAIADMRALIRHDPDRLARVVMSILNF
jgi:2-phospho-L-lactate transferase/gluconeogenesis factor (CofD/UPF0052 family)